MRRLPVYLVIDCSHSMRGEPLRMVSDGVQRMVDDLRGDPHALETVWLSIISFSTGARQDVALTSILDFQAPALASKGRTDMGAGLRLLAECIDREVRSTTESEKGDWRPTAFLLSDGGPSDAWITPAREIRSRHENGRMEMVAVGFGKGVHIDNLRRVTPRVLTSDSERPEAFSEFLRWASVSVGRSVQTGATGRDALAVEELPVGFSLHPDAWRPHGSP